MKIDEVISKLQLQPHPEGGYFREIVRSTEFFSSQLLPERYKSERSFYTSIYFLLKNEQKSHFHKLNSDEIWFFHFGSAIKIHIISEIEGYRSMILGNNIINGEDLQITIPRGCWFGAELIDKSTFGLISCAVVPGFDFEDFVLADKDELLNSFPQHHEIINFLTFQ